MTAIPPTKRRGRRRASWALVALAAFGVVYVCTFFVLRWRGAAFCRRYGIDDSYVFADTRTHRGEEFHYRCFKVFLPMILLDRAITGTSPTDCIMWGPDDIIAAQNESWR